MLGSISSKFRSTPQSWTRRTRWAISCHFVSSFQYQNIVTFQHGRSLQTYPNVPVLKSWLDTLAGQRFPILALDIRIIAKCAKHDLMDVLSSRDRARSWNVARCYPVIFHNSISSVSLSMESVCVSSNLKSLHSKMFLSGLTCRQPFTGLIWLASVLQLRPKLLLLTGAEASINQGKLLRCRWTPQQNRHSLRRHRHHLWKHGESIRPQHSVISCQVLVWIIVPSAHW